MANMYRVLGLLALVCLVASTFAAETPAPAFPLWDGKESIEQYAKRVNLPATQTLDLGGGVKLELVLIPAGKFIMGSPETEKGRRDNETQHEVTITQPFYMGKYVVTQEQYEKVMGANPSHFKGAKNPVETGFLGRRPGAFARS